MVQWLRIQLLMQETQVHSLTWEDPHAMKHLSPWATASEVLATRTELHSKAVH